MAEMDFSVVKSEKSKIKAQGEFSVWFTDGHLLALACMVEIYKGTNPKYQGSWLNSLSKVLPPNLKQWRIVRDINTTSGFGNYCEWDTLGFSTVLNVRNSGEAGF